MGVLKLWKLLKQTTSPKKFHATQIAWPNQGWCCQRAARKPNCLARTAFGCIKFLTNVDYHLAKVVYRQAVVSKNQGSP
jgi:hypothetical protein